MAVPYVELKDKYGNNVYLGHCGDTFIPAFPTIKDFRQRIVDIKEMDLKPNDVIIAGFPKTGTHWHCEIVHMLMTGSASYAKDDMLAARFLEMVPSLEACNSPDLQPRYFFTHLKFHHLPKQVWEKKVKVIYLERNPKDTWVSMYNHVNGMKGTLGYDGTWNHFFDLITSFGSWYGDWFDCVLGWEKALETQTDVDIFKSSFEDMKRDPVGQIQKIDEFLGLSRGQELCEKIAEACSFTKMKEEKGYGLSEELRKKMFKETAIGFYRKGEVGDWKNWFTVAQNEQFDELYQKRMAGSKLRYTFVQ